MLARPGTAIPFLFAYYLNMELLWPKIRGQQQLVHFMGAWEHFDWQGSSCAIDSSVFEGGSGKWRQADDIKTLALLILALGKREQIYGRPIAVRSVSDKLECAVMIDIMLVLWLYVVYFHGFCKHITSARLMVWLS